MIWPGIDTILENVHSPLNSTKKSRRKRLHFEDDDNCGDQDKEIRDIENSFAEININGIESSVITAHQSTKRLTLALGIFKLPRITWPFL
jgi:hypothetical protein